MLPHKLSAENLLGADSHSASGRTYASANSGNPSPLLMPNGAATSRRDVVGDGGLSSAHANASTTNDAAMNRSTVTNVAVPPLEGQPLALAALEQRCLAMVGLAEREAARRHAELLGRVAELEETIADRDATIEALVGDDRGSRAGVQNSAADPLSSTMNSASAATAGAHPPLIALVDGAEQSLRQYAAHLAAARLSFTAVHGDVTARLAQLAARQSAAEGRLLLGAAEAVGNYAKYTEYTRRKRQSCAFSSLLVSLGAARLALLDSAAERRGLGRLIRAKEREQLLIVDPLHPPLPKKTNDNDVDDVDEVDEGKESQSFMLRNAADDSTSPSDEESANGEEDEKRGGDLQPQSFDTSGGGQRAERLRRMLTARTRQQRALAALLSEYEARGVVVVGEAARGEGGAEVGAAANVLDFASFVALLDRRSVDGGDAAAKHLRHSGNNNSFVEEAREEEEEEEEDYFSVKAPLANSGNSGSWIGGADTATTVDQRNGVGAADLGLLSPLSRRAVRLPVEQPEDGSFTGQHTHDGDKAPISNGGLVLFPTSAAASPRADPLSTASPTADLDARLVALLMEGGNGSLSIGSWLFSDMDAAGDDARLASSVGGGGGGVEGQAAKRLNRLVPNQRMAAFLASAMIGTITNAPSSFAGGHSQQQQQQPSSLFSHHDEDALLLPSQPVLMYLAGAADLLQRFAAEVRAAVSAERKGLRMLRQRSLLRPERLWLKERAEDLCQREVPRVDITARAVGNVLLSRIASDCEERTARQIDAFIDANKQLHASVVAGRDTIGTMGGGGSSAASSAAPAMASALGPSPAQHALLLDMVADGLFVSPQQYTARVAALAEVPARGWWALSWRQLLAGAAASELCDPSASALFGANGKGAKGSLSSEPLAAAVRSAKAQFQRELDEYAAWLEHFAASAAVATNSSSPPPTVRQALTAAGLDVGAAVRRAALQPLPPFTEATLDVVVGPAGGTDATSLLSTDGSPNSSSSNSTSSIGTAAAGGGLTPSARHFILALKQNDVAARLNAVVVAVWRRYFAAAARKESEAVERQRRERSAQRRVAEEALRERSLYAYRPSSTSPSAEPQLSGGDEGEDAGISARQSITAELLRDPTAAGAAAGEANHHHHKSARRRSTTQSSFDAAVARGFTVPLGAFERGDASALIGGGGVAAAAVALQQNSPLYSMLKAAATVRRERERKERADRKDGLCASPSLSSESSSSSGSSHSSSESSATGEGRRSTSQTRRRSDPTNGASANATQQSSAKQQLSGKGGRKLPAGRIDARLDDAFAVGGGGHSHSQSSAIHNNTNTKRRAAAGGPNKATEEEDEDDWDLLGDFAEWTRLDDEGTAWEVSHQQQQQQHTALRSTYYTMGMAAAASNLQPATDGSSRHSSSYQPPATFAAGHRAANTTTTPSSSSTTGPRLAVSLGNPSGAGPFDMHGAASATRANKWTHGLLNNGNGDANNSNGDADDEAASLAVIVTHLSAASRRRARRQQRRDRRRLLRAKQQHTAQGREDREGGSGGGGKGEGEVANENSEAEVSPLYYPTLAPTAVSSKALIRRIVELFAATTTTTSAASGGDGSALANVCLAQMRNRWERLAEHQKGTFAPFGSLLTDNNNSSPADGDATAEEGTEGAAPSNPPPFSAEEEALAVPSWSVRTVSKAFPLLITKARDTDDRVVYRHENGADATVAAALREPTRLLNAVDVLLSGARQLPPSAAHYGGGESSVSSPLRRTDDATAHAVDVEGGDADSVAMGAAALSLLSYASPVRTRRGGGGGGEGRGSANSHPQSPHSPTYFAADIPRTAAVDDGHGRWEHTTSHFNTAHRHSRRQSLAGAVHDLRQAAYHQAEGGGIATGAHQNMKANARRQRDRLDEGLLARGGGWAPPLAAAARWHSVQEVSSVVTVSTNLHYAAMEADQPAGLAANERGDDASATMEGTAATSNIPCAGSIITPVMVEAILLSADAAAVEHSDALRRPFSAINAAGENRRGGAPARVGALHFGASAVNSADGGIDSSDNIASHDAPAVGAWHSLRYAAVPPGVGCSRGIGRGNSLAAATAAATAGSHARVLSDNADAEEGIPHAADGGWATSIEGIVAGANVEHHHKRSAATVNKNSNIGFGNTLCGVGTRPEVPLLRTPLIAAGAPYAGLVDLREQRLLGPYSHLVTKSNHSSGINGPAALSVKRIADASHPPLRPSAVTGSSSASSSLHSTPATVVYVNTVLAPPPHLLRLSAAQHRAASLPDRLVSGLLLKALADYNALAAQFSSLLCALEWRMRERYFFTYDEDEDYGYGDIVGGGGGYEGVAGMSRHGDHDDAYINAVADSSDGGGGKRGGRFGRRPSALGASALPPPRPTTTPAERYMRRARRAAAKAAERESGGEGATRNRKRERGGHRLGSSLRSDFSRGDASSDAFDSSSTSPSSSSPLSAWRGSKRASSGDSLASSSPHATVGNNSNKGSRKKKSHRRRRYYSSSSSSSTEGTASSSDSDSDSEEDRQEGKGTTKRGKLTRSRRGPSRKRRLSSTSSSSSSDSSEAPSKDAKDDASQMVSAMKDDGVPNGTGEAGVEDTPAASAKFASFTSSADGGMPPPPAATEVPTSLLLPAQEEEDVSPLGGGEKKKSEDGGDAQRSPTRAESAEPQPTDSAPPAPTMPPIPMIAPLVPITAASSSSSVVESTTAREPTALLARPTTSGNGDATAPMQNEEESKNKKSRKAKKEAPAEDKDGKKRREKERRKKKRAEKYKKEEKRERREREKERRRNHRRRSPSSSSSTSTSSSLSAFAHQKAHTTAARQHSRRPIVAEEAADFARLFPAAAQPQRMHQTHLRGRDRRRVAARLLGGATKAAAITPIVVVNFSLATLRNEASRVDGLRRSFADELERQRAAHAAEASEWRAEQQRLSDALRQAEAAKGEAFATAMNLRDELTSLLDHQRAREAIADTVLRGAAIEKVVPVTYLLTPETFGECWQESILNVFTTMREGCLAANEQLLTRIRHWLQDSVHSGGVDFGGSYGGGRGTAMARYEARLAAALKAASEDEANRFEIARRRFANDKQRIEDEAAAEIMNAREAATAAIEASSARHEEALAAKVAAMEQQFEAKVRALEGRQRDREAVFSQKLQTLRRQFRDKENALMATVDALKADAEAELEERLASYRDEASAKEQRREAALDAARRACEQTEREAKRYYNGRFAAACAGLQGAVLETRQSLQELFFVGRWEVLSNCSRLLSRAHAAAEQTAQRYYRGEIVETYSRGLERQQQLFARELALVEERYQTEISHREAAHGRHFDAFRTQREEHLRAAAEARSQQNSAFWAQCQQTLMGAEKYAAQYRQEVDATYQRRHQSIIAACQEYLERDVAAARRAFEAELSLRREQLHGSVIAYHRMDLRQIHLAWAEASERARIVKEFYASAHCLKLCETNELETRRLMAHNLLNAAMVDRYQWGALQIGDESEEDGDGTTSASSSAYSSSSDSSEDDEDGVSDADGSSRAQREGAAADGGPLTPLRSTKSRCASKKSRRRRRGSSPGGSSPGHDGSSHSDRSPNGSVLLGDGKSGASSSLGAATASSDDGDRDNTTTNDDTSSVSSSTRARRKRRRHRSAPLPLSGAISGGAAPSNLSFFSQGSGTLRRAASGVVRRMADGQSHSAAASEVERARGSRKEAGRRLRAASVGASSSIVSTKKRRAADVGKDGRKKSSRHRSTSATGRSGRKSSKRGSGNRDGRGRVIFGRITAIPASAMDSAIAAGAAGFGGLGGSSFGSAAAGGASSSLVDLHHNTNNNRSQSGGAGFSHHTNNRSFGSAGGGAAAANATATTTQRITELFVPRSDLTALRRRYEARLLSLSRGREQLSRDFVAALHAEVQTSKGDMARQHALASGRAEAIAGYLREQFSVMTSSGNFVVEARLEAVAREAERHLLYIDGLVEAEVGRRGGGAHQRSGSAGGSGGDADTHRLPPPAVSGTSLFLGLSRAQHRLSAAERECAAEAVRASRALAGASAAVGSAGGKRHVAAVADGVDGFGPTANSSSLLRARGRRAASASPLRTTTTTTTAGITSPHRRAATPNSWHQHASRRPLTTAPHQQQQQQHTNSSIAATSPRVGSSPSGRFVLHNGGGPSPTDVTTAQSLMAAFGIASPNSVAGPDASTSSSAAAAYGHGNSTAATARAAAAEEREKEREAEVLRLREVVKALSAELRAAAAEGEYKRSLTELLAVLFGGRTSTTTSTATTTADDVGAEENGGGGDGGVSAPYHQQRKQQQRQRSVRAKHLRGIEERILFANGSTTASRKYTGATTSTAIGDHHDDKSNGDQMLTAGGERRATVRRLAAAAVGDGSESFSASSSSSDRSTAGSASDFDEYDYDGGGHRLYASSSVHRGGHSGASSLASSSGAEEEEEFTVVTAGGGGGSPRSASRKRRKQQQHRQQRRTSPTRSSAGHQPPPVAVSAAHKALAALIDVPMGISSGAAARARRSEGSSNSGVGVGGVKADEEAAETGDEQKTFTIARSGAAAKRKTKKRWSAAPQRFGPSSAAAMSTTTVALCGGAAITIGYYLMMKERTAEAIANFTATMAAYAEESHKRQRGLLSAAHQQYASASGALLSRIGAYAADSAQRAAAANHLAARLDLTAEEVRVSEQTCASLRSALRAFASQHRRRNGKQQQLGAANEEEKGAAKGSNDTLREMVAVPRRAVAEMASLRERCFIHEWAASMAAAGVRLGDAPWPAVGHAEAMQTDPPIE